MRGRLSDVLCRMLRIIFLAIVLPILLVMLSFALWAQSRLPYSTIKEVKERSQVSRSRLGDHQEIIFKLAVAAEGREGIATYSAKILAHENDSSIKRRSTIQWHLDVALWRLALEFFFNDQEVFLLWCSITPYKDGRGIWDASEHYFDKPLQELEIRELAALVASVRSPARYEPGTRNSEDRVDEILEIIHRSPNTD